MFTVRMRGIPRLVFCHIWRGVWHASLMHRDTITYMQIKTGRLPEYIYRDRQSLPVSVGQACNRRRLPASLGLAPIIQAVLQVLATVFKKWMWDTGQSATRSGLAAWKPDGQILYICCFLKNVAVKPHVWDWCQAHARAINAWTVKAKDDLHLKWF